MSKGPGRIERAIATAFTRGPNQAFSVDDLALIAYPGINRVEKKHRVATMRAARKLILGGVRWTWSVEQLRGGKAIYYNLLVLLCHKRR